MKRLLGLVALLLAATVLTACGDDGSGDAADAESSGSQFNDADVTFAQGMIPHHEQAVEMAQMAEERAQSPDVKQLAADIEAAQAPEIEQLTTWLEAWGEEVPGSSGDDGGMSGMDHGGDSMDMGEGMMSSDDMAMLSDAKGAEFDRMFLEMMTEHHQGAVEMAETEVADGEHPDAIRMAEDIIATQEAEIEEMKKLLAS